MIWTDVFYVTITIVINLITFTRYAVVGQHDPYWERDHSAIVHLFEWKFKDIARECEEFLAPNGYGGVQVSPVNEYLVSASRAWWERYQPISYKIISRSGNIGDFLEMSTRCNAVGIRIYVDVVFNHMAAPGENVYGTGGSRADPLARDFPAVPFTHENFHPSCGIQDYGDSMEVRNCELGSLPDLNQTQDYVREQIVKFLNDLIDLGVAGFRVDACKHMWPEDLAVIFGNLKNLNTSFGFADGSRPFLFQEVIDLGQETISKFEYEHFGAVTEFSSSSELGLVFHGLKPLNELKKWGTDMGFLPSESSLVFVDNHDNQRGHGAGGSTILTHKEPQKYRLAEAFLLAHPFGVPRVMSSYYFNNSDQGPPSNEEQIIESPKFDHRSGQCLNGWVCEHRWPAIRNMIKFRNVVGTSPLLNWSNYTTDQISFCRGDRGFIAINNSQNDMRVQAQACVPPGIYCDVISGEKIGIGFCTGLKVIVTRNRMANILIPKDSKDLAIAIHINSRLF